MKTIRSISTLLLLFPLLVFANNTVESYFIDKFKGNNEKSHLAEPSKDDSKSVTPSTKAEPNPLLLLPSYNFSHIVARVSPAVVNISTGQKIKVNKNKGFVPRSPLLEDFRDFLEHYFDYNAPDTEREITSLGSGFIIDPTGLIVTNYHVVMNADEIKVTLSNNEQYKARVLGGDLKTDLAVIKVDPKEPLPYLEFGSSEEAKVGEWVIAIGNPFGFGGSVSAGIISARSRDTSAFMREGGAPPLEGDFIQTDAAINRGNSGGPLLNIEGKVIGINSAIYSPTGVNIGLGFAIPSTTAKPVIQTLSTGNKIRRGWIGVSLQEVDKDVAESLERKDLEGAPLVADLGKGSPAAKGGVYVGDIIIEFADQKIDSIKKLRKIVHATDVDTEVNITVLREIGKQLKPQKLKVKVGQLDEEIKVALQPESYEVAGICVSNLSAEISKNYGIQQDVKGVVVVEMKASKSTQLYSNTNLQLGDVIVSVNLIKINNIEDFKRLITEENKRQRDKVVILINRKGRTSFTTLKIK